MQLNNVVSDWLSRRKITPQVQETFNIHVGKHSLLGECITIPVHDVNGEFLFNKYRRNPLDDNKPKYVYDVGGKVTLYAIDQAKGFEKILITEGEMDCLVSWSHNIPSVTSTGGAQSFQKDWASFFTNREVIICYDNDNAGAEGMVKTLAIIPHAKVLFLPDMPNVKDISDYVAHGGNLNELIKTARGFNGLEEVKEDRTSRLALFKSTFFHDAYIKEHTKVIKTQATRKISGMSDKVTQAKTFPITDLLEFVDNKAVCPFHSEKTPSLHYYESDNHCYCFGGCGRAYDSIDIYRKLHNATFMEAIKKLA